MSQYQNSISDLSGEDLIKKFFSYAGKNKLSAVAYRLPLSNETFIVIGKAEKIELEHASIETIKQGFLFSEFHNQGIASFINADIVFSISKKLFTNTTNNEFVEEILAHKAEEWNITESNLKESKENYQQLVASAREQVRTEALKKVVLARSKTLNNIKIQPEQLFFSLAESYPESFITLLFDPIQGTWSGASPELLISLNKEKKFQTIALAGTQKTDNNTSIADATWGQKEIEEQALVSRYIINSFKSVRLREFEEEGPKTVRSGNILHLKTIFTVPGSDKNYPRLSSRMLNLLHPTSAVGGMPRKEALDFIQTNESLNRQLFAGFLGPVNIEGEINIFVNIRCAKLFRNSATLFAGAGITENSDPEKEFQETELKMEVIGRLLTLSS